ncbi:MAG: hypothetical protein WAN35_09990 [Terracidiphilus sp.]
MRSEPPAEHSIASAELSTLIGNPISLAAASVSVKLLSVEML